MKQTLLKFILSALLILPIMGLNAAHSMHPLPQIAYVKKKISEQQEPYYTAYKQLLHYADSIVSLTHHAVADFSIPELSDQPEVHQKNSLTLQQDAFGAYCCALAYQLSGKSEYGEKACYFLNAWATINKGYSGHDGPLVMTYSGSGLLLAAELLSDAPIWDIKQKDTFSRWTSDIYQKAANGIRTHKDYWGDWGRFGSLLAASFFNEKEEIRQNVNLIKSDLFTKIIRTDNQPDETLKGIGDIWDSYFSLAPLTASCWMIYHLTGENLFVWEHDGASIKESLDYLLYSFQSYANEDKDATESHQAWPGNLIEAMNGVYNDTPFIHFTEKDRPHICSTHHFAWVFPTLMPISMSGYDLSDNNTWANYNKYELENKTVKQPIAVFMGNSITEGWFRNHPDFFKSNNYIGRGISGQVTAQMLARFRRDVLDLKPKVVSILAGTNDIAQNCQYMSVENIAGNIFSMAELAQANGIKVIICSTLPASHYPWRPAIKDPARQIIRLNKLLKKYANQHNIPYVDFHSIMKDKENGLPEKYSKDGVHPTPDGYTMMESIIKEAITNLLVGRSDK